MGGHPLHILVQAVTPDLHLHGLEAFGEIAVGLGQQFRHRQFQVDAADIGHNLGVVPA